MMSHHILGEKCVAEIHDTVFVEIGSRKMRVVALDALRVAKVWLSKSEKTIATEEREDAEGRT